MVSEHKCGACGATFPTQDALMAHGKAAHMGGRSGAAQHKCGACGATFPTEAAMMEHGRTSHAHK